MKGDAFHVPVDRIVFDKALYPRFEADNATVNQYRQSIEELPPILVTRSLVLVDGYHRLLAHRLEERKEIAVEYVEGDGEKELLVEAIKRNSAHGRQLTVAEKRENARRLKKLGMGIPEIATTLSVGKSTAYEWLRDLVEEEDKRLDGDILELYLQCLTLEEIGARLGLDETTVGRRLANTILQKSTGGEMQVPDFSVIIIEPD